MSSNGWRAISGSFMLRPRVIYWPGAAVKTLWLAVILLSGSTAFGQSQPTSFKAHRMGETFTEWIVAENINMEMCVSPKRDVKDACKRLGRIQAGENLDFSTTDGKQTRTFGFSGGILREIEIPVLLVGTTFDEQLGFLIERYGKPSNRKTVTYQNAMGAKWECGEAEWLMPDGAGIMAAESIENLPISGPTRKLTITIMSKEKVQDLLAAEQKKQNPY